jgi:hypothetical protein
LNKVLQYRVKEIQAGCIASSDTLGRARPRLKAGLRGTPKSIWAHRRQRKCNRSSTMVQHYALGAAIEFHGSDGSC